MTRLEYKNVTMQFPDSGGGKAVTAIQNVSFAIADGEVVSLIGPSGCGKSTLLNIGAGLYSPAAGEAHVDGQDVTGMIGIVGYMLQKDLLLPWRTIAQNVMFGLEIRGMPFAQRSKRAVQLLGNFHLEDFCDHYPHQLSGGMRQRAALARTLAVDPTVLLLDEPFSAVDAQTRIMLQHDLAQTLMNARKTALLITHDIQEAVILSDRVLVMSRRPGTIVEEIQIDIPDRANPLARRAHPKAAGYISMLMDRLQIVPPSVGAAASGALQ